MYYIHLAVLKFMYHIHSSVHSSCITYIRLYTVHVSLTFGCTLVYVSHKVVCVKVHVSHSFDCIIVHVSYTFVCAIVHVSHTFVFLL